MAIIIFRRTADNEQIFNIWGVPIYFLFKKEGLLLACKLSIHQAYWYRYQNSGVKVNWVLLQYFSVINLLLLEKRNIQVDHA